MAGTSTLAESLRIPPYCASITWIAACVSVGWSSFTTAATASAFTSGSISPGPGTHGCTAGNARVGEAEGVGVPTDGLVVVADGVPLADGVVDGGALDCPEEFGWF